MLTTTTEIPVGGYRVTASLYRPQADGLSAFYRPGEDGLLDRVTLGYVAVPWDGAVPDGVVPIDAEFGNQIQLMDCACPPTATPGETVPISLYWTATNPDRRKLCGICSFVGSIGSVCDRP